MWKLKLVNIINRAMVEFKCNKCSKNFYREKHLQNHLNRKNLCDKKENQQNKCQYCKKLYSRKDTLNRHIKSIHSDVLNQTNNVNAKNVNINCDQKFYNGDVTINNNN